MRLIKIKLMFTAMLVQMASAATIVDVVLTAPKQTRGEGDQFPWTQLANGDHMTVVNDGYGPHTAIGNNMSRVNADIWANFGPTYNHKPWRVTNMDLCDLNNPQWITSEIGYNQDGPSEKLNGANVSAFYAFGCLAVADNGLIVTIALAGSRHNNSTYTDMTNPITWWGGNAFITSSDAGGTWLTRTGKRLDQVNWGEAMAIDDCTLIPVNVSGLNDDAFTLCTFLQMGPGYQANTDGYVYLYSPSALQNDRDNASRMKQRRTVVARCFIETDHSNHTAVWNPANWKVWDGSDWSSDFSQGQHVMEWPGPGTKDGQAWYPSVVYLPSESIYVAISSEKDMANYPTIHPGIHVMQAPKPEGPWTLIKSFTDIDLQGDNKNRIFGPYWIPGWCDRDAGIDDNGRRLIDCYYSTSGIGNVYQDGWGKNEKKRYGVNVGKMSFSLDKMAVDSIH